MGEELFARLCQARVRSRRGELTAAVFVTATVQPGQMFIPMHYAVTNRLTLAAFDPYSRQPAYKACAVRVEAVRRQARRVAGLGDGNVLQAKG